jgi:hypothetical protein
VIELGQIFHSLRTNSLQSCLHGLNTSDCAAVQYCDYTGFRIIDRGRLDPLI